MEDHPLRIQRRDIAGHQVLSVVGDIDLWSASVLSLTAVAAVEELRSAVPRGGGRPARLLLDMSEVPFMDSAGLGALVDILRRAHRAGVVLVVVAAHQRVLHLLEATGLARVLTLHPDLTTALEDIQRPRLPAFTRVPGLTARG